MECRQPHRSPRSLIGSLAIAACLWPTAASAQAPHASGELPTVQNVRGAYSTAGYQVGTPINWSWTSPSVSSFQVHDTSSERVLMVLVYPDAAAAHTAQSQARLVFGYGPSTWNGTVALVQTTQAELDRAYQRQNDRDNCVDQTGDASYELEVSNVAVDIDFQQTLSNGLVNL
jgi:hypothetical protein